MIQAEHLTKRYGGHLAVDDISFTVKEGTVYGLLGPNGAGKSTTMNILSGRYPTQALAAAGSSKMSTKKTPCFSSKILLIYRGISSIL